MILHMMFFTLLFFLKVQRNTSRYYRVDDTSMEQLCIYNIEDCNAKQLNRTASDQNVQNQYLPALIFVNFNTTTR
jgi:hypothetical protein